MRTGDYNKDIEAESKQVLKALKRLKLTNLATSARFSVGLVHGINLRRARKGLRILG